MTDDPRLDRYEIAGRWSLRIFEGDLSSAQEAEFDAWLAKDPENALAFEKVSSAWKAVDDVAYSPNIVALRGEALAFAGRRPPQRPLLAKGWARWAAAAVLLMAVVGGLTWRSMPTTYVTAVGDRRVISLADGSRLSLDASTRVDVQLSGGRRELWLRHGRAKFAAAGDTRRPFTVTAGGRVVLAMGTEFSEELLRQEVRVILYQGRVMVAQAPERVVSPGVSQSMPRDQDVVLAAGQELLVSVSGQQSKVVNVDLAEAAAWESGQLVFEDEPLATAVERINRYSVEKLVVADSAASRVLVSGVFTAGETATFIKGVTTLWPVRAVKSGQGVELVSQ